MKATPIVVRAVGLTPRPLPPHADGYRTARPLWLDVDGIVRQFGTEGEYADEAAGLALGWRRLYVEEVTE